MGRMGCVVGGGDEAIAHNSQSQDGKGLHARLRPLHLQPLKVLNSQQVSIFFFWLFSSQNLKKKIKLNLIAELSKLLYIIYTWENLGKYIASIKFFATTKTKGLLTNNPDGCSHSSTFPIFCVPIFPHTDTL